MSIGRLLRALRLELVLGGAAYAGLLCVTRPAEAARALGLSDYPWSDRLFPIGVAVALAALGCLALRLWARLWSAGRRVRAGSVPRAVAGTVMAEFALVLPIVLLVMCMIAQLALLANASLVVRYAAFASARSAIVSFESDTATTAWQKAKLLLAFPPFPEWVDEQRPELAAQLVLASLSPVAAVGSADARALEAQLRRQPGSVWASRSFEERMEYAKQATRVTTTKGLYGPTPIGPLSIGLLAYRHSLPPAIQVSEHIIPPYRLSQGLLNYYLPMPSNVGNLVPTHATIPLPKIEYSFKYKKFPEVKIPLQPPLPKQLKIPIPAALRDPVVKLVNDLTNPLLGALGSGYGPTLDLFAKNELLNVDAMSPKEVHLKVEYDFLLNLPSLHFVPGLNLKKAPAGVGGKTVTLSHRLRLQSTGGRRANLAALLPLPNPPAIDMKTGLQIKGAGFQGTKLELKSHGPLYWPWP